MLSFTKMLLKIFLFSFLLFLLSCAQTAQTDGNVNNEEKPNNIIVEKEIEVDEKKVVREVSNDNYQDELQRHMSELRQMDDRNQEIKRRQEIKEIKEWLYGNWEYSGYDEWVGRYTMYVSISENKLRWGYNGKESYNGPCEIDMNKQKIYFNRHNGFSTCLDFSPETEMISDGEGHYFKKVNRSVGPGYSSSYSGSSFSSSNQSNVRFRTDSDVIAYTSSHTFKNSMGNRISISFQGMYVNGKLLTNAPRVVYFNGSTATISVSSPYNGGGAMIISVDASRGVITDGSGDVFRMVN